MKKAYLGIDQSYTFCGIVLLNEDGAVEFSTIHTSTGCDIYDRAGNVASHIGNIIKKYKPAVVGVEGLAFAKFGNATRDLAGLLFVIMNKMRTDGVNDISIIPPNTLKKSATGSGKATKEDMVNALPEDVKVSFKKQYKKTKGLYDIADAYWIARHILDENKTSHN